MITFKYTDTAHDYHDVCLELTTRAEHLEGVVESFKSFMLHVGHHYANVERVVYEEKEGLQGLPQQLELPL